MKLGKPPRNAINYDVIKMISKNVNYKVISKETGLSRDQINNVRRMFNQTQSIERVMEISDKTGPKDRRALQDFKDELKLWRSKGFTTEEIVLILDKGYKVESNVSTVKRYLETLGEYKPIRRRSQKQIESAKALLVKYLPVEKQETGKEISSGGIGGLFLFLNYLNDRGLKELSRELTDKEGDIKNYQTLFCLIGMKLLGYNNLSDIKVLRNSKGFGYFCGLDDLPSVSFLQKFINRLRMEGLRKLQLNEYNYLLKKELISGDYLNIDYSASPYYGKEKQDKNYVPQIGYSIPSLLRCYVQDQESGFLLAAFGDVSKDEKCDIVNKLFYTWKQNQFPLPKLLVLDSKFLPYKKIKEMQDLYQAQFISLRKKGKKIIKKAKNVTSAEKVSYRISKRFAKYKKYEVFSEIVKLKYIGNVKQVVLYDNNEPYKFIITNKFDLSTKEAILVYDKRWGIEHNFHAQVDFFELHTPNTNNPIRADLDVTLNIIAYNIYKEFQLNFPPKLQYNPKKAYENYVKISNRIIENDGLEVYLSSDLKKVSLLRFIPHFDKKSRINWIKGEKIRFFITS